MISHLIEEQRGQTPPHREGHHHAGPNTTVLLHPSQPPDGKKKIPNSKQDNTLGPHHLLRWTPLSRERGPPNPPLSTPLSRARGSPNLPHGSTLRSRSKNCRQGSKKRCPTPHEPNQSAKPPVWFEIIMLFSPSHEATAMEPEDRRCHSHCLLTLYHTGRVQPCWTIRHDLLQAKSSLVAVAASIVLQHCPTPHLRCPSKTRRRGTLRAALQQPSDNPDHQQESKRLDVR
jgi:hypothetical protein